jgi:hypothetical protein
MFCGRCTLTQALDDQRHQGTGNPVIEDATILCHHVCELPVGGALAIVAVWTHLLVRLAHLKYFQPYLKHTKIVSAIYETLGWSDFCLNFAIVLSIRLTVHIFIHSRLHLSFSATYSIHRFVTVTIHRYDSNHSTGLDSRNDLWKVHSDSSLRRSASPRSRESCHRGCNYPMSPRM